MTHVTRINRFLSTALICVLLASGLLLAGCTLVPEAQTTAAEGQFTPATVVRVIDGDTAVFRLDSGAEEKTRLIGVDTPESTKVVEEYGREAAAFTASALTPGRRVELELDVEQRDRYGRLLAYVWLERPTVIDDAQIRAKMFNAHLALEGFAQQMTIQPNSRYADVFTGYVREARDAGRGLWGGPIDPQVGAPQTTIPQGDSEQPSAGSGQPQAGSEQPSAGSAIQAAYVGNRNTGVFHQPTCSSVGQMNPANRVALGGRDEAVSQGYRPCGRCNP